MEWGLGGGGCRGEREGEDVVVFTVKVRSLRLSMAYGGESRGHSGIRYMVRESVMIIKCIISALYRS